MPEGAVPYVNAYGNVTKTLRKIQDAATPDRFTQDFLATKLGLKGGSAKPVIPFLKRIGFLGSDGSPTELYKSFRNKGKAGAAVASALRKGYASLYELNEYAHDLSDADLKGIIVQATGLEESSSTVRGMVGSFKALKDFADFDAQVSAEMPEEAPSDARRGGELEAPSSKHLTGLNLGYTINLHLPSTSDIAVFNAIFKSLRDNLLSQLER